MKKIFATILIAIIAWVGSALLSPAPASAAPITNCNAPFLTFRPWYSGLTKDPPECNLKTPCVPPTDPSVDPACPANSDQIPLTVFVWTIILNILSILFGIVGYLAIGFVIYGGFTYVMARGDPSRIAKGKNTVIRAIIGLIICILASLISNLIVSIITEATTKP